MAKPLLTSGDANVQERKQTLRFAEISQRVAVSNNITEEQPNTNNRAHFQTYANIP